MSSDRFAYTLADQHPPCPVRGSPGLFQLDSQCRVATIFLALLFVMVFTSQVRVYLTKNPTGRGLSLFLYISKSELGDCAEVAVVTIVTS